MYLLPTLRFAVLLQAPLISPSPPSLPEWTILRNNAITSMNASRCACVIRVFVCVCVCLCRHSECGQTLPGGEHGCSLLFLLLFQITVCFINAMVIWLPLLLFWSPRLTKMQESSKDTHWSKRLQRPRATQPVPTVSIFHECCWRKVAVGELQQTICSKQRAGNIAEPPVEWPGPCVAAWPTCFSLYAYLRRCFSLGWLIDMKHPRLNMLQNKLSGGKITVVLPFSSSWSNSCEYQSMFVERFSCSILKKI